jgi:transposase|tara:strand:- start:14 stop:556 length:543 start_codon:yes stop_codon:yes gene_type:complete
LQGGLDAARLVFIDETWIRTNMAPQRGWGARGKRLYGYAPHGRWRTLTFLGALRHDSLVAPCVFDGPINGACFRAYVEQLLLPTLRPGDIVILDNLGSHKSKAVRNAIREAGAKLWFLPKYSPDLNPIEQAFAKIKHWMRMAQRRTIEDTWRHVGHLVGTFKPDECANFLANAGYGSVKT